MSADSISQRVIEILNQHNIPYMVVGSLSTNFHSIIRSTKDADIVIQSELGKVASLVAREYPELQLDPQFYFEGVTATTKMLLRSNKEEFAVELFGLSDDPHDQSRFAKKKLVDWGGHLTWIASLDDAIVTKLRWALDAGRKKDIVDVQNMIAVNGNAIDWPYVEKWCDQHGSRPLLEEIREELRRE